MPRKTKDRALFYPMIWRNLVNFWTLVLYVVTIADFFMKNALVELLGPICAIYIALLAIYTAEKEFERWNDYNIGRHPGEYYVFAWTGLILILLALELVYHESYRLPSEVFSTYIVVLGILAITRKSKSDYYSTKKGK
ncbi:MAG TPA: hypothetical protein VJC13_00775 [Candidatus Paceibacterota bacterium]